MELLALYKYTVKVEPDGPELVTNLSYCVPNLSL